MIAKPVLKQNKPTNQIDLPFSQVCAEYKVDPQELLKDFVIIKFYAELNEIIGEDYWKQYIKIAEIIHLYDQLPVKYYTSFEGSCDSTHSFRKTDSDTIEYVYDCRYEGITTEYWSISQKKIISIEKRSLY